MNWVIDYMVLTTLCAVFGVPYWVLAQNKDKDKD